MSIIIMNSRINFFCSIFFYFMAAMLCSGQEIRLSNEATAQLLSDITAALADVNTIRADIKQVRELSVFNDTLVSAGICYFKDPDKLRWEIKEPYHSILIYNWNKIAKFEYKNGKLTKLNTGTEEIMQAVMQEIIYWMKGDFSKIEERYEIGAAENQDYVLLLVPKSEGRREHTQNIRLGISKESLHILYVSITEVTGDSVSVYFYNEINNIMLDDRLFNPDNPSLN